MRATNRRRAFTLLEVLLVIVLLGVLFAITLPSFTSTIDYEQLNESALRMKAMIGMCRAQAMNESRRYRVIFEVDGTVRLERQLDPIYAPHVFMPVREMWAQTPPLLERVFVEAVLDLPDGPPPFDIQDELVEFEDIIEEPVLVSDLENALLVEFEPDGQCDSVQWVLRDIGGRGVKMTLEGRLGRVRIEEAETIAEDEVTRPELVEVENEYAGVTEAELLEEYLP